MTTYKGSRSRLRLAIFTQLIVLIAQAVMAQPIRLHPRNPHYFLYRQKPVVLITSAEHYGGVLNLDFDFITYLDTLARDGLNYTRLFSGSYFEPQGAFNIQKNTLAPTQERLLTPWERSQTVDGKPGKFDLSRWNEAYFRRLRDFIQEAGKRGIVVEMTLFSAIYGDAQWNINPLNPLNNINQTDTVKRQQVHTMANGNLLSHQERLVRKIVRELNRFDNLFYEIQNEPWADNHVLAGPINSYLPNWEQEWRNRIEYPAENSLAWQKIIASYIRSEEAGLSNRHLIAQNYTNFRYPLKEVDPAVSIINFHYAYPEAVSMNYGWDRVIGLDETGFAGSVDRTYRRIAWNFMLAGGGLFNNLDYSFTVEKPDGTDANRAPGGGSVALRQQLGILKRFIEGFDFIRMRPDPEVIALAPGVFRQALSQPGQAYAIYLNGQLTGALQLHIPAGSYQVTWVDVTNGKHLNRENRRHKGGRMVLEAPDFQQDIAVKVLALRK
jgi:hypothetical protein